MSNLAGQATASGLTRGRFVGLAGVSGPTPSRRAVRSADMGLPGNELVGIEADHLRRRPSVLVPRGDGSECDRSSALDDLRRRDLAAVARRRPPRQPSVGGFAFGFIASTTLLLAGFVSGFLIAYRAPTFLTPGCSMTSHSACCALSGAPTAIALASYAMATFRNSQLPRFTAWLAALAAVAQSHSCSRWLSRAASSRLRGRSSRLSPGSCSCGYSRRGSQS